MSQLAFPGAIGHAKYAVGGRGGTVYTVTNLNDYNPDTEATISGSLREAVLATGPRIVVFAVSGTITLSTTLKILDTNITIFGQTAPGDGICVEGLFQVAAGEAIIQHVRFRYTGGSSNKDGIAIQPDGGSTATINNVIIDHCSVTWGTDELLSSHGLNAWITNVSITNNIIAHNSDIGHNMASLFNLFSRNFSYIGNFLHGTSERHPSTGAGVTLEVINNVIDGFRWGTGTQYGTKLDFINNHYKEGSYDLASSGTAILKIANTGANYETTQYPGHVSHPIYGGPQNYVNTDSDYYLSGNTTDATYPPSQDPFSVTTAVGYSNSMSGGPVASSGYTAKPVAQNILDVIAGAGATLPRRDSYDTQLAQDYTDDVKATEINDISDVGGLPTLNSLPAPTDTSGDGMPDVWKVTKSLDINTDHSTYTFPSGYVGAEEYAHSIGNNVNQLAFPTAKGSGAYNQGGAGGTVLHVDTLANDVSNTDSTHGSFKWCLQQPFPRIIVFDVGGEIDYYPSEIHPSTNYYGEGDLLDGVASGNTNYDNVTIAGETAPGGITLSGMQMQMFNIKNIVMRYVRFSGKYIRFNFDVVELVNCEDITLDHCSFLYGNDESLTVRATDIAHPGTGNFTMQRCLLSSSKTGSIMGGEGVNNITMLENAYLNTSHRFPNPKDPFNGQLDVINNVVFNWKQRLISINFSGQNTDGNIDLNIIGNYYKRANGQTDYIRFECHKLRQDNGLLDEEVRIYNSRNKMYDHPDTDPPIQGNEGSLLWGDFFDDDPLITDNWFRDAATGQFYDQFPLLGQAYPIQTAEDALTDVLGNVGANAYLDDNHNKVSYNPTSDDHHLNEAITGDADKIGGGHYSKDHFTNINIEQTGTYKVKLYNIDNNAWEAGAFVTVSVGGVEVVNDTGVNASSAGHEISFNVPSTSQVVKIKVWWETKAYQNKIEILNPSSTVIGSLTGYYQSSDPETPPNEYQEDQGWGWANVHLNAYTRPVGWTTQPDGIPDTWKTGNGKYVLDVNTDYSNTTFSVASGHPIEWNGYTGIQIYLNEIDGDVTNIPVTGVTVNESTLVVNVPDTGQLTYTIAPPNATNPTGTWSSDNEAIATVNQAGVVTAVSAGGCIVTFETTDGGFTDTSAITITAVTIPVATVDVTPDSASSSGETVQFAVNVLPANASDKTGVWSSSVTGVATVDQAGLVTVVDNGQTDIKFVANDNGIEDSSTLTVSIPTGATVAIPVNSDLHDVKEEISSGNIYNSDIEIPNDTGQPGNSWINAIRFEPSGPNIIPTGKNITNAYIEFTCSDDVNSSGAVDVTVQGEAVDAPVAFTLTNSDISNRDGNLTTASVTWSPENWTVEGDKYTTNDLSSIIQELIDRPGYSTTDAIHILMRNPVYPPPNDNTRHAESYNYSALDAPVLYVTYDDPVGVPVTGVTLNVNTLSLPEDNLVTSLVETVAPANADVKTGTWASDNPTVLSVDNTGLLTPKIPGVANVSFTTTDGGFSDSCEVTVTAVVVNVTGVALDNTTLEIEEGRTDNLTVTVSPPNATDKSGTWTTTDAGVASIIGTGATVSIGAESVGTATIEFESTDGGFTHSCVVTVVDPLIEIPIYIKRSVLKGLL